MEIACADCGCLVDRGVRLIPCASEPCCCAGLPVVAPMEILAARLRTSLNARDVDAFRSLVAEDAMWGEDPNHPRTCHNRNDIIATYKRLLDEGVDARVVDTTTGPGGVACTLEVQWPEGGRTERGPTIYQSFLVVDGLVTRVQGHDDPDLARAAIAT